MTREQLTNLLTESGVENPSKLLISAILNSFQEERNEAVKTAVQEAETRVKEQFKDYKTPDEFKALADENATLKDSEAKTARIAKYRGKGINEKYFDYADNVLKGEKDLDAKLEEFVANNAELLVAKDNPKSSTQTKTQFGKVDTKTDPKNEVPATFADAVKLHYEENNK